MEPSDPTPSALDDAAARPAGARAPCRQLDITHWRTIQRDGVTILSLVVCRDVVEDGQGVWGTPEAGGPPPRPPYRVLRLNAAGHYDVRLWPDPREPSRGVCGHCGHIMDAISQGGLPRGTL